MAGYWTGKHIYEETKEKISKKLLGHKNWNGKGWKLSTEQKEKRRKYSTGDTKIKAGRMYVMCDDREWRLRYRLNIEKSIGRKLLRTEYIHHIDENPLNDDIENLVILSLAEHNKIHKRKSKSPEIGE